jgi:hypothetical protein
MTQDKNIRFTENPTVAEDPARYVTLHVRVADVVESWRDSLFSFEWLNPDGEIKSMDELKDSEQEKRRAVEKLLKDSSPIPMPILGIGMMDNIEIGSGRAEFLTLAACGVKTMPVHIPKSCETDFKPFLADVKSPA